MRANTPPGVGVVFMKTILPRGTANAGAGVVKYIPAFLFLYLLRNKVKKYGGIPFLYLSPSIKTFFRPETGA